MLKVTSYANNAYKQVCRGVISVVVREKNVWTNEKIVKSPFNDIEIPNAPFHEFVWSNLDKWATKTATVCGVTNRQYTYEQIYKQSQILGANLRKKFKIDNGDTVAILMPNLPEYPTAILGILTAGGIVTTMNPNNTAYEVQRQITMSDAKLIIVVPEIVPVVKQALSKCKKNIPIVALNLDELLPEGAISFKELTEDVHVDLNILKEVNRTAADVAFLPYSSGTTGLPKGVEQTHLAVVANVVQQDTEVRQYEYTTESHQDTVLVSLPIFHCYGLVVVTLHKFHAGLKLVTLPKFKSATFINTLSKFNFNLFYFAPPTVLFLGSHPEVQSKHFEHLRCVTCGAAPLPLADIEQFLEKVNPKGNFCQAYGLTETGPLVTASPLGFKDYSKVGFGLPNLDLRIVDGNLNNLGPNEVGELLVKGPNVMKGYKDNIEATKQAFLDEVWFRTGDMAQIDEFGAVGICDRLKELIKVNAYQVPPAELENVCKEHPDVFDAAVVSIPDPNTGEKPKAFIVLKENAKVSAKDIMKFVAERVAPYKRIKEVSFIEEIPKNPSGKILRKNLKEKYC